MSQQTKIQWTETTWNPTTGCDKISQGCKFCYAEIMTRRLKAMGQVKYKNGFEVTTHENELDKPGTWKNSQFVFVNSMSDLFHKEVPFEFIQKVFKVMNDNPQHIFQVLTKRADILLDYNKELNWTPNIWMGVTLENEDAIWRSEFLKGTDAKIKFLSCEPLLSSLTSLNVNGIDWVIVGGESGRKPRPIKEEWVDEIHEKCRISKISFFFKQWGGTDKKKSGNLLHGAVYKEMPITAHTIN